VIYLILEKSVDLYPLRLGFSNFFGWRPENLPEKSRDPQEILQLSKCTNTKIKVLIFALFAVFYDKNFFF
jgi:hypothetical protein